jgi:hypothetical protein
MVAFLTLVSGLLTSDANGSEIRCESGAVPQL